MVARQRPLHEGVGEVPLPPAASSHWAGIAIYPRQFSPSPTTGKEPRMPRKPGLRVVDPDTDTPDNKPPTKATTVTAASDSGDRRAVLIALRTRLAKAIDNPGTPARDLAALSRRLLEVTKDLESLAADEPEGEQATESADERWEAI